MTTRTMRTITLVVRNEYSFLQENFGIYLNEYISGCLDGTYKTPEYDLENEIEKEMKNDFYGDEELMKLNNHKRKNTI